MAAPHSAWKPGYCPNPKGRPPGIGLSKEVLALQKEARSEVVRTISECLLMKRDEIGIMMANPESTMVQLLTGSVIAKALKEGDMNRMVMLLNYVMGRPKPIGPGDLPDETGTGATNMLSGIPSSVLLDAMKRQTNGDGSPAAT